uniref:Uncharacterized protein n=1 Tax=Anguilla anguilla TaxID=7936 RepID=A0A0E9SRZ2_ANGAN
MQMTLPIKLCHIYSMYSLYVYTYTHMYTQIYTGTHTYIHFIYIFIYSFIFNMRKMKSSPEALNL